MGKLRNNEKEERSKNSQGRKGEARSSFEARRKGAEQRAGERAGSCIGQSSGQMGKAEQHVRWAINDARALETSPSMRVSSNSLPSSKFTVCVRSEVLVFTEMASPLRVHSWCGVELFASLRHSQPTPVEHNVHVELLVTVEQRAVTVCYYLVLRRWMNDCEGIRELNRNIGKGDNNGEQDMQ